MASIWDKPMKKPWPGSGGEGSFRSGSLGTANRQAAAAATPPLQHDGKFKGGLPATAHAHEAGGGRATGTGREPMKKVTGRSAADAGIGWQPPTMSPHEHATQVLIHHDAAERHESAHPMRRAFEAMARGHAEKAAGAGHGTVERGEKGGMYYTAPSGHRVYLGGNK